MLDEKDQVEESAPAVEEKAEDANPTPEIKEESTKESANEAEEKVEEVVETPPEEVKTPHDEFDWTKGKRDTLAYDEKEIEKYLKDYESSLSLIGENEIVSGTVTAVNGGDVVLDINYKSDGLVSLSEFRDQPDLKIGDKVDVYVEHQEDERGQLVLSRRKAKLLRAWEDIVDSYKNGSII